MRKTFAHLTRTGSVAIAVAAIATSLLAPQTAQAASVDLQPSFTAADHPITDVAGLVNARLLGSVKGASNRTVNSTNLIRSESLDKLTPASAKVLADKYDVKLVIDLRTPTQIAAAPDVPIPGAKTVDISLFGDNGDYSDDTVMYHDLVNKGYVDSSDRGPMISGYAKVLQELASVKSGTVLIHCSHGMDRTGTVMDLLYHILGVSDDDILHDYLLSNTMLNVTWATPDLLQGTFEQDIATKFGGMDNYLAKYVGVTPREEAQLRHRYLLAPHCASTAGPHRPVVSD
ncbi:MAG: protein tyrosine/serine phosphatase [Frondihabitans sp.]|nr:protein tyrosine/serine phosphatase [Frondihabitans sp.]